MRFYFIAPAVLALAGCAAPESQVALSDPNAPRVELECHQEASLGSNMIHKVCAPKQTDAQRAVVQADLANQLHVLDTHSIKKSD
jgi:hypothetical protein